MIFKNTRFSIVNLRIFTLLTGWILISLTAVSQNYSRINLEEIPQRKVRKYIVSRSFDQMPDFNSIHASWNRNIDESDFNVNEKTFYLNYKLASVWETYRHYNPAKMWHGHSVRFGLLISKYSNTVLYTNSSAFPEIDTGQIYFLDLRLLKGLFNVPVAFEIITIDQDRQIMEFSYIENNKSLGKQTLQFFDNGDGRTRINHWSYFKSKSSLRDNIFYPYFHNKFIKDFHRNMRQLIKNNEPVIANLE
jgi:hypothetical protein